MTRRNLPPISLSLAFLSSFPAAAAPTLTRLGTATEATSISADGSAVAGNFNSAAFHWTAASGTVFLDPPASSSNWTAEAVSQDGSIIVGSAGSVATFQAARWDSGSASGLGVLQGTPFPGAAPQAVATGISADGSVIVGYSTSVDRFQEAFRLENDTFTALGVLPGGTGQSRALAISADGSTIVGQASSPAGDQAFVLKDGQPMQGLGDFAGGPFFSLARAVSANGGVVVGTGTVSSESPSGAVRAFRWTAGGGLEALPLPVDAVDSEAFGVSSDGSIIVGQSSNVFLPEATVWTVETGGVYLMPLLEAKGVDLEGLRLYNATAISADGNVIAGKGFLGGNEESWVIHNALELFTPDVPLPEVEIAREASTATLTFSTEPDFLYQVEKSPDLGDPWSDVGAEHSTAGAGDAGEHQVTDPDASANEGFYRVRVSPAS